MQQERRKEGRSPSYLAGTITTDRRLIAIECVVRNTSGAGARLVVPHAEMLPDVFELHIPKKNCAYQVRARWRDPAGVGVEIVPPDATEAPIPFTLARRLKILEAENAALKRRLSGGE